tara:strand:+ start:347 stop:640 length:294 start_codon:yes stop_codon:yes gene_type:complete
MPETITTQLERHNLEAHVDLCAERYRVLEKNLNNVENRLDNIENKVTSLREENMRSFSQMREDNIRQNQTTNRYMLGAAASVIAGVLTVVVTILMSM